MDPIEKYSLEECRDTIDKSLLITLMSYIRNNSSYYLDKYMREGLGKMDFPDIRNFPRLPFTTKDELLAEQELFPPFGRLATRDDKKNLRRVHITSGSTGKPFYIILTESDLAATVEAGRRAFLCAGLTPEDTVVHCLNYCLWAGGVTDHLNLEATGATVIPYGVGNSKNLIKTILSLQPTAISCTPSYLSKLEYILKEEFAMTPLGLKAPKSLSWG